MRKRISVIVLALLLALTPACSDSDNEDSSEPRTSTSIGAVVASYDLAVGGEQRFLVGLTGDEGQLVSFGDVELNFSYLGPATGRKASPQRRQTVTATWFPVAGQKIEEEPTGPKLVNPSEGTGVYEAQDMEFDEPGVWQVEVVAALEGDARAASASATFEVLPDHRVIAPGDEAPSIENHLPGTAAAPAKAVDSRAEDDGTVPDPELHSMTVAAALASGKPTLVVVSTPVYCQSRFCGPITDSVQLLAQRFGNEMNFIHLEVWQNFEDQAINKAAADWIYRDGGAQANEPFVFVIDRGGVVRHRLDNAISDAQLDQAVMHELNEGA